RVDDITWTSTQMGKGDSDTLLEPGEKMQIQVNLTALSPVLDAYDQFSIELKPEVGSSLTITRTVPATVDDVMNLK
ncbi:MAG: Flagellin FlaB1, partial [Dehalococcoidia bacterium]|nr:Flagellin FlaB1 [Dehalococcoidia bacterium]